MKLKQNEQQSGKPRVSKNDWLNAALDVLCSSGVEALRVEKLAQSLGVAKSGFYYHFKDRNGLYAALLDYWIELDHSPKKKLSIDDSVELAAILKHLVQIVQEDRLDYIDFAIRQWAMTDPKVLRIYNCEMNARISHVREIFKMLDFEGENVDMRIQAFITYALSERMLFPANNKKDRAARLELFVEMLSKPV